MMTKKDYIKFADMIVKNHCTDSNEFKSNGIQCKKVWNECLEKIQDDMIELFKQDNPAFDENRFNQYIEQKVKQLTR